MNDVTTIDLPVEYQYQTLQRVTSVRESYGRPNHQLQMVWTVRLIFETFYMHFSVNHDTDEIIAKIEALPFSLSEGESEDPDLFSQFIGRGIGYIWKTKNSHGYDDLVVLSFDDLRPAISLYGMASCIDFYTMHQVEVRTPGATLPAQDRFEDLLSGQTIKHAQLRSNQEIFIELENGRRIYVQISKNADISITG